MSIPNKPAKIHIIPAKPAIPKPGRTKNSIRSRSIPKTNIATSTQLASPMRYLLPIMIVKHITAARPGNPTPGVLNSIYTPNKASITRTAITAGELIHRTISSDQLVSSTIGSPAKLTPSRFSKNSRAPPRSFTTALAMPYSRASGAISVSSLSLSTTISLLFRSYIFGSLFDNSMLSKNSSSPVCIFLTL